MTTEYLADVTISDADTFRAVLAEAVEQADHAGVEVRGGWEIRTAGSTLEWEVQVFPLRRDGGGDGE